jgi:DNA polymerase III subunit gamma/tau
MSYLVLARKYRPRNFSEMVGQSHVVQALGNALTTQRLHHAYLFTGTRGVGKTTVSRILAKSLNCTGADGQGDITSTPCGACQACRDIDSGRFVDYTELDAASNRGVDEIAQLLEQAVYKPVVGRFKVFMIDEVHMLTNTAFNAMLKTLEEPPAYLKFVLATTDPQKVPATVLSRCLQFNLRPMAPETILEHLLAVLATENVSAEPQALRLLARAARGSMRDALSLTDQAIAFGSGVLVEAGVRQMLGSVDRSYVYQLLDALSRGDGRKIIETVEVLRLNGLNAASTLEEMTGILQRMAVLQAVPDMSAADDPHDPDANELARLAAQLPDDETQLLYSLCLHGRAELGLAPDEYAALTMVLLRLLPFKRSSSYLGEARNAPAALPEAGSAVEPGKKSSPEVARGSVAAHATERGSMPPVGTEASQTVARESRSVSRPIDVPVSAAPAAPGVPTSPAHSSDGRAAEMAHSAASTPADAELGDRWAGLVNHMVAMEMVSALVRELALQSELCAINAGHWKLRVDKPSLNHPSACDKLLAVLQSLRPESGEAPLRLEVEMGLVTDTPAHRLAAAQAERQRLAEESIHSDPFVQDMMRNWGARIVPGSLKPVTPDAVKPI